MRWIAFVAAAGLAACGAGDDTVEGARAQCTFGGQLNDCPEAERTPEAACWRLVDCGAIPVSYENPEDPDDQRFDWGNCVNFLEGRTADRQRVMIGCIATAVCDELRVEGSPGNPNRDQIRCIRIGDP